MRLVAIASLFAAAVTWSGPAFGTVTVDGNAFYFSDSYDTATSSTYTRLFWDFALSINLMKKGQLMLGWDYNSAAFDDNINSTATTISVTGMGPKFAYYFDKEFTWSLAFTYDLILNASAGSGITYTGSAMKGELGYTPQIGGSMYFGLKLNYYRASLTQQISNQTTLAPVSYSRTAIYPSIAFIFRWGE